MPELVHVRIPTQSAATKHKERVLNTGCSQKESNQKEHKHHGETDELVVGHYLYKKRKQCVQQHKR